MRHHPRFRRHQVAQAIRRVIAPNAILVAQCGINWYSRRRDAGIYWTHCKTCGQWLHYTDDKNAKPQECKGRKP